MNVEQEYVFRIKKMVDLALLQGPVFRKLLTGAQDDLAVAAPWMTVHDWSSTACIRECVVKYDIRISEFSPYTRPRYCREYRDWITRALEINRYPGWEYRGMESACGYCIQALAFQYSVFRYLALAVESRFEEFLPTRQCKWLAYLYGIPRSDDDGLPF